MITLEIVRQIVQNNMPFDTGFMFSVGARYNETEHHLLVYYDTIAVPYIIYNEEGSNNNRNKGFISVNTVNEISYVQANLSSQVVQNHLSGINDVSKLRSSLIQSGVFEYVYNYPSGVGGDRDAFVG
jgi:hypothetical protein